MFRNRTPFKDPPTQDNPVKFKISSNKFQTNPNNQKPTHNKIMVLNIGTWDFGFGILSKMYRISQPNNDFHRFQNSNDRNRVLDFGHSGFDIVSYFVLRASDLETDCQSFDSNDVFSYRFLIQVSNSALPIYTHLPPILIEYSPARRQPLITINDGRPISTPCSFPISKSLPNTLCFSR